MARGIAIAVDRTASWWLCTLVASLPSLLLVGCLPIPWTQYQQPAITGQLRWSGQAVPGQVVTLAVPDSMQRCGVALAATTTDSLGRFSLPAQTKRQHFISLMEIVQEWMLCTRVDGHEITLAQYASLRAQRYAQVDCTLSRPEPGAAGAPSGSCDIHF
jgi:hypothetical protein